MNESTYFEEAKKFLTPEMDIEFTLRGIVIKLGEVYELMESIKYRGKRRNRRKILEKFGEVLWYLKMWDFRMMENTKSDYLPTNLKVLRMWSEYLQNGGLYARDGGIREIMGDLEKIYQQLTGFSLHWGNVYQFNIDKLRKQYPEALK